MRARARLAQCDSEQARAKHHKAGCSYREESIAHEVAIAHATPPAAGECWSPTRTERLSLRTVKRISSDSENWKLTDALEQQRPRSSGREELREPVQAGGLSFLDRPWTLNYLRLTQLAHQTKAADEEACIYFVYKRHDYPGQIQRC